MRISVIIPTYNSAPLVVEAVESVLAQTRPAAEVIVVDDGSTDDTEARLAPFRDRIQYVRQPNGRVAAARNTGLRLATGELIGFLDADDAWHPSKLERQVAALESRPDVGLLATGLTAWPGPFAMLADPSAARINPVSLAEMLLFNPLATSSIVVRRSIALRAGPFDTELFGPEDYDLWLRCAQLGQVAVLDEPLTGYRDTAGSLGKQADTMRRGLLRIHAKLEAAGVWKHRPWFRRKCRAHVDYSTGYMYFAGGRPEQALRLLVRSLLTYPLPMWPPAVRYRWGRLRLLLRSAAKSVAGGPRQVELVGTGNDPGDSVRIEKVPGSVTGEKVQA
ncbi:MAG: glycosyltransferase family A protein [Pirellulaceae bacterium]